MELQIGIEGCRKKGIDFSVQGWWLHEAPLRNFHEGARSLWRHRVPTKGAKELLIETFSIQSDV